MENENIVISEEILNDLRKSRLSSPSRRQKIQKVPSFLRAENKDSDYDPKVVSIGPYHHGRQEFQFVEEFKYKVLENFVSETDKDINFFYHKILEVINDIRDCYVEGCKKVSSDPELARIILLDSIYLLNHMESITQHSKDRASFTIMNLGLVTFSIAQRDVFLLENQIPIWVLEMIATLRYENRSSCVEDQGEINSWKKLLDTYCKLIVYGENHEHVKVRSMNKDQENEQPLHLLEIIRDIIVRERIDESIQPRVQLLQTAFQKYFKSKLSNNRNHYLESNCTFRSVRDLKAKGILFRPSNQQGFSGIKFKSYYLFGKLYLPTETINNYTKVFYGNMIAYEMSPDTTTSYEVTCYVNFMKSLITSPADVKELREREILLNTLGTDEEAVRVLQTISTYGMLSSDNLTSVKQKIQHHVTSEVKKWTAKLFWIHLSNVWSILALVAAILLLFLTFVQTYFTINPKK